MQITRLVARHLGLEHFRELEPNASINGVTIVELEVPTEDQNYRVQLVKDSQFLNVKLEEGAKLAAFYNSRFWHEAINSSKHLAASIPSARFFNAFQVSDEGQKYSVYLTKYTRGYSKFLDLHDFEEIARIVAKIHAVQSDALKVEFENAVEENFGNIKAYRRKIQKELVQVLDLAVTAEETSKFFRAPSRVLEKVSILIHHLHSKSESSSEDDHLRVICHGNLKSENIRFNENGKIVEITDWENIHLGNPAEDLTNLIISSGDTELQRRTYMKVFHQYFYTLVDIRPPKYQLPDLKRWFRENHAKIVVDGIEQLLIKISDEDSSNDTKFTAAQSWEQALDNAVDYITDNYLSDDEQVFFSNK